jgi:hypothetical protein
MQLSDEWRLCSFGPWLSHRSQIMSIVICCCLKLRRPRRRAGFSAEACINRAGFKHRIIEQRRAARRPGEVSIVLLENIVHEHREVVEEQPFGMSMILPTIRVLLIVKNSDARS